MQQWVNRLSGATLFALLLLAVALRFYALDASSLWSDEGNTWALVQRSFGEIAQAAAADIHPPGYYWLLKAWSWLWGHSAYGLRAFSALCGVLLVGTTYWAARQLPGQPAQSAALLAALIVALNPFQVYYSQEARMYMLLTLVGAWLYGALMIYMHREWTGQPVRGAAAAFWGAGALGLWLHYSFPILLLGAGLAYLWHWVALYRREQGGASPALLRFGAVCLAMLAPFVPWLGIAVRQVFSWPHGSASVGAGDGLRLTLETLLFGPIAARPLPSEPWLWAAALLPLFGLWVLLRRTVATRDSSSGAPIAIALWFLTPIGMMFGLGLYSDAFLKFLLAASPAWAIALAWSVWAVSPIFGLDARVWRIALGAPVVVAVLWLAATSLPAYYTDPTARDNYAGIARYVAAHDLEKREALVLLNAPGQQDVWNYYDPGLSVLALPTDRPPDRALTEAALTEAASSVTRIFAVYWATNESDPEGIVESWLANHAYPGLETWQGNIRFIDYSLAAHLQCTLLPEPARFGQHAITLTKFCTGTTPTEAENPAAALPLHISAAANDVLLFALGWQPLAAPMPDEPVAISLQILDARNQVIAQRDARLPDLDFTLEGEPIVIDRHGIPIPVGTPPGNYRLILALYNPETGARLGVGEQDALDLGRIAMQRVPAVDAPLIPARTLVAQSLGPLTLLGYDLHRKDYAHAPDTPLAPGDAVQVTLYWQAPSILPEDWPADLTFTLTLGNQQLQMPLAGGDYPTAMWQAQEVVRARFDIPYDGSARHPQLQVGNHTLRMHPLP